MRRLPRGFYGRRRTPQGIAPRSNPPAIDPERIRWPTCSRIATMDELHQGPEDGRDPTPRTRNSARSRGYALAFAVAASLLLGGLSLAIVREATPTYRTSSLATSGSFFALADSGNTLYAASDNGGSILLEKSMDQGTDWSSTAVPYPAVAGGAPWDYAAVAADGSHPSRSARVCPARTAASAVARGNRAWPA